jgi:uncharacterized membrane protein YeaQ/YmgE (transglycosylase-associated protein family)
VVFLVVSVLIGGLVIGALGRLIVPGPTPLGCLGTIGVGVLGAIIGGAVARALYRYPDNHPVISLLLEVGAAAVLVSLLTRGRGGYRRW